MKRPPGLWILLSAGVLWLSLQDVYGIRATALIFGKSTTTTTTTTEGTSGSSPSDETATESSTESNVTKPTLTGIPQVDYIWDPNLPKELNGYNLSAYPFYERVPEDIDFKCDGLHDGFYASVPHKCQVYHHCLFGTRYDFLCANYTAFDQKTFICHFVSEVDCVNSKKYWHRNDALYKAASTSTAKPLILHTTAPPADHAQTAPPAHRPGGNRRRPFRRRRPQYDYYEYDDEYDDYYDERPRFEARRRKRPRPRPRPIYADYEEDYEDDRYERRGSGRRNEERNRRRGADDRRLDRRRNNKDRRKYDDDDKFEEEDKFEDERKSDNKRVGERGYHKRRPADEYASEDLDRRRNRPKGRPSDDYEEDEVPQNNKPAASPVPAGDKPIIKPTSGSSIYDRPRAAPKIKPPVPKNEADKYAYKPLPTKAPPAAEDEEYYDDYEEEVTPKSHRKSEMSESRRHSTRREETRDTRKQMSSASRTRTQSSRDDSYDDEPPRRPYKPKYGSHHRERPRSSPENKKPPTRDEDYDDYEEELSKERSRSEPKVEKPKEKVTTTTTTTTPTTTKITTTTTTTTTTPKPITTTPKDMPKPENIVRIVKRPFLPSRGGNPYSSRGLQPVGAKAVDKKPEIKEDNTDADNTETMEVKPLFKPSPVIIKMPLRQKYLSPQPDSHEDFKPVSNRPLIPSRSNFKPNKEYSGPRTTQKPKLPEPDPLDIEEDEYDVTLNDALNPTLPNLPVRSFPTGFSSANDYNYTPVQRPRYVLEGASSDYVYQTKPVRQRFEAVPYTGSQDHFVNSNTNYKGQYSTINGQSLRPRLTQAYYSSF